MAEDDPHCHASLEPSAWVAHYLAGVPPEARVLDLACGRGRHLRLALERGHAVTGLDRDISGLADLAGNDRVRLIEADLEGDAAFPLKGETFAGVIVANYLWRPLLAEIAACVARDGMLIYETFAQGNERYGKPKNPEFLLKANELIEVFAPILTVIAFDQGLAERPYPRLIQRIAACGPAHPWTGSAPPPLSWLV